MWQVVWSALIWTRVWNNKRCNPRTSIKAWKSGSNIFSSHKFVQLCNWFQHSLMLAKGLNVDWWGGREGVLKELLRNRWIFFARLPSALSSRLGKSSKNVLLQVSRKTLSRESVHVVQQPSRKTYLKITILFTDHLWELRRSDAFTEQSAEKFCGLRQFCWVDTILEKVFFGAGFLDSL